MQASFTPEEQQTIDRLREKYIGLRVSDNADEVEDSIACLRCEATPSTDICTAAAKPQTASTRAASSVEASICPHCNGTGTLVEIYNHRRIETFCKTCDGRGVRVFKHGVEVVPGAGRGTTDSSSGRTKTLTSGSAAGPAGVVSLHNRLANDVSSSEAGGGKTPEVVRERVEALQRDLKRIAERAALYIKERSDALALLTQPSQPQSESKDASASNCTTEPASNGAEGAARELTAQLDLQLEKLEAVRRKKTAALERLTGGYLGRSGVSLGDIIAKEGGAGA